MRIVTLSEKFWREYAKTPELMDKPGRPYCCLVLDLEGFTFCIPFRHHIRHPFAFKTVGDRGIDFSKSVVVLDDSYIDDARVDAKEYSIIIQNEDRIIASFLKYLRRYRRALKHKDNPRSSYILRYSTLQYFDGWR